MTRGRFRRYSRMLSTLRIDAVLSLKWTLYLSYWLKGTSIRTRITRGMLGKGCMSRGWRRRRILSWWLWGRKRRRNLWWSILLGRMFLRVWASWWGMRSSRSLCFRGWKMWFRKNNNNRCCCNWSMRRKINVVLNPRLMRIARRLTSIGWRGRVKML